MLMVFRHVILSGGVDTKNGLRFDDTITRELHRENALVFHGKDAYSSFNDPMVHRTEE